MGDKMLMISYHAVAPNVKMDKELKKLAKRHNYVFHSSRIIQSKGRRDLMFEEKHNVEKLINSLPVIGPKNN